MAIYIYKKMPNFFSSQGNSDDKYKEIIFHTRQNCKKFVNSECGAMSTLTHSC